jgi:hypothetical protein
MYVKKEARTYPVVCLDTVSHTAEEAQEEGLFKEKELFNHCKRAVEEATNSL